MEEETVEIRDIIVPDYQAMFEALAASLRVPEAVFLGQMYPEGGLPILPEERTYELLSHCMRGR